MATIRKRSNPETGSETVSVASKMPFDFTLRLFDFVEKHEPVMGGGSRSYKIAEQRRGTPEFVVMGNSFPQNKGPHQPLSGGYAITHGIPKDFWEAWLEQHAEADYVVNSIIFAQGDSASITAETKEKEGVKTNIERLDPNNLPKGLQTSDAVRRAA